MIFQNISYFEVFFYLSPVYFLEIRVILGQSRFTKIHGNFATKLPYFAVIKFRSNFVATLSIFVVNSRIKVKFQNP